MLVTELKRIDDKRYCLYMDYEPYCSLYASDIKRLKLDIGADIDNNIMEEFRKSYLYKRAMNKAVASLKFSEKCEYDIRLKLEELFYDSEIIDFTISKLKAYGYIDDLRYAAAYIRKYIHKKGRKIIRYELSFKKINEAVINKAFDMQELPNEKEAVISILNKKFTSDDIIERREKVVLFFIRKGFSSRLVLECINELCEQ